MVFQDTERFLVHHLPEPRFHLTITLAPTAGGTLVSWRQEFEGPEFARRLEHILRPSNEQNLDRLTAEVVGKGGKG